MTDQRDVNATGEAQESSLSEVLQIRRDKLLDMQKEGKDPFQITKYDVTHHSEEIKAAFDELEGKEVSIAGRMMSKRVMGKASFCHVQDRQGTIQSYVARDNVGEESYKAFKKYDIGDLVGIRGTVFRTKTGEISMHRDLLRWRRRCWYPMRAAPLHVLLRPILMHWTRISSFEFRWSCISSG